MLSREHQKSQTQHWMQRSLDTIQFLSVRAKFVSARSRCCAVHASAAQAISSRRASMVSFMVACSLLGTVTQARFSGIMQLRPGVHHRTKAVQLVRSRLPANSGPKEGCKCAGANCLASSHTHPDANLPSSFEEAHVHSTARNY